MESKPSGEVTNEKSKPERKEEMVIVNPRDVWDSETLEELELRQDVSRAFKTIFGGGSLLFGLLISLISRRKEIKSAVYTNATSSNFSFAFMALGSLILFSASPKSSSLTSFSSYSPNLSSSRKSKSFRSKFEFSLLNDRLAQDFENFEIFSPKVPDFLPYRIKTLFSELERAENAARGQQLAALRKQLYGLIRKEVENKTSGSVISRQLNPRVFVFEFNDLDSYNSPGNEQSPNNFLSDRNSKEVVTSMSKADLENLSSVITFLLETCSPFDEVAVMFSSPGGSVVNYGLCFAEFSRLKTRNIKVTFLIDKISASGGYLVSCLGDKIVSSPFALIGSIGVVTELPNFHRLLNKLLIDYELFTAGEYKRTVHTFAENTESGKEKLKHELESIHNSFKQVVYENRKKHFPEFNVEKVSTGQAWLAKETVDKKLGLVDELKTSEEYLSEKAKSFDVVLIRRRKKNFRPSFVDMIYESAFEMKKNISEVFETVKDKAFGDKFGMKTLAKL